MEDGESPVAGALPQKSRHPDESQDPELSSVPSVTLDSTFHQDDGTGDLASAKHISASAKHVSGPTPLLLHPQTLEPIDLAPRTRSHPDGVAILAD